MLIPLPEFQNYCCRAMQNRMQNRTKPAKQGKKSLYVRTFLTPGGQAHHSGLQAFRLEKQLKNGSGLLKYPD